MMPTGTTPREARPAEERPPAQETGAAPARGTCTRRVRMAVDIAMTAILPLLMAYSLVGEAAHEVLGVTIFALFVAHHVLNRRWFANLPRGRWTPRRVFQTALDAALLVVMVAQPVSGILISRYLFASVSIPGTTATARAVHLCLGYWGLVLMSVHAGTHLAGPLAGLRRRHPATWRAVLAAALAISCWGVRSLFARDVADYLLGTMGFAFFDASQPLVPFLLDYLAMMVLFATVGAAVSWGLGRLGRAGR